MHTVAETVNSRISRGKSDLVLRNVTDSPRFEPQDTRVQVPSVDVAEAALHLGRPGREVLDSAVDQEATRIDLKPDLLIHANRNEPELCGHFHECQDSHLAQSVPGHHCDVVHLSPLRNVGPEVALKNESAEVAKVLNKPTVYGQRSGSASKETDRAELLRAALNGNEAESIRGVRQVQRKPSVRAVPKQKLEIGDRVIGAKRGHGSCRNRTDFTSRKKMSNSRERPLMWWSTWKTLVGVAGVLLSVLPTTSVEGACLVQPDSAGHAEIPNSTITLGNSAFIDCFALVSVAIPTSVRSIGNSAFQSCTRLVSVTIPNSVTVIGRNVFVDCSSLVSVTIPNSVNLIGSNAFPSCLGGGLALAGTNNLRGTIQCLSCVNVTTMTIPAGVISIANSAFQSCTSERVVIPIGVTSIGFAAFRGCPNLALVEIPDTVTTIAEEAFDGCRRLAVVRIPDSVTAIGPAAFRSCGMTAVFISNSLTSINDRVFSLCTSLSSLIIPDSVLTLGESACFNCTSLTTLIISDGVTTIRANAFTFCESLVSVVIPDSVTTIAEVAFEFCRSLASVTIPATISSIRTTSFPTCLGYGLGLVGGNNIRRGVVQCFPCINQATLIIPDVVATIGPRFFESCQDVRSVHIPDSVTTIGLQAFESNVNLESVVLGDSVTTVGDNAFFDCRALSSITLPDSVATLGVNAFFDCGRLTSVVIPPNVSIGLNAFEACGCNSSLYTPGAALCNCQSGTCAPTAAPLSALTEAPTGSPISTPPTGSPNSPTAPTTDAPTGAATASTGSGGGGATSLLIVIVVVVFVAGAVSGVLIARRRQKSPSGPPEPKLHNNSHEESFTANPLYNALSNPQSTGTHNEEHVYAIPDTKASGGESFTDETFAAGIQGTTNDTNEVALDEDQYVVQKNVPEGTTQSSVRTSHSPPLAMVDDELYVENQAGPES